LSLAGAFLQNLLLLPQDRTEGKERHPAGGSGGLGRRRLERLEARAPREKRKRRTRGSRWSAHLRLREGKTTRTRPPAVSHGVQGDGARRCSGLPAATGSSGTSLSRREDAPGGHGLLQRRSTKANRAAAGDELGGPVSRRAAVRRLRGGAAGRDTGLQGVVRRAQKAAASYLWGRARRRRRRPGLLAWHAMAMAPGLDRVWRAWLPGRSGPGWAAGTGQEVGRLDGFDGLRKKLEGV
jgi:hypothetical protein